MVEIKLLIMAICAALFWLGGFCFLPARRFIMPVILTGYAFLATYHRGCVDWWTLSMLSSMGVFCLGYGEKSPLRHCFGNGWGRGVWGLLAALTLSLALFVTHHIVWFFFVPYLALNFTLENALKNIPQVIGDPIIGLGFSLIVFLIH